MFLYAWLTLVYYKKHSFNNIINLFVPNSPFLYPLKTSGGRERAHWKQMGKIKIEVKKIWLEAIEVVGISYLKMIERILFTSNNKRIDYFSFSNMTGSHTLYFFFARVVIYVNRLHYVKKIRLQGFIWSVFSHNWTECGYIQKR